MFFVVPISTQEYIFGLINKHVLIVREVLMLCASNAITEHHQPFLLALTIRFQAVRKKMTRSVFTVSHYSVTNFKIYIYQFL